MEVKITERIKKYAEEYQRQALANVSKKPNYTGIHDPNRFYTGTIGELAFGLILKQLNKKFDFNPRANGLPDDGDFVLYKNSGLDFKVDVKTTTHTTNPLLMLHKKQVERKIYPCYIGAVLYDDIVRIDGYAIIDDFKEPSNPKLSHNIVVPHNQLRPIDKLMEAIQ